MQPEDISQKTQSSITGIQSLRLPANYGATLGVKKLLTNVPVGRPEKMLFFRTHANDQMTFPAMLLEQKESRERYVVTPDIAQVISELVRPVMLYTAIDRQDNIVLIPVPLPDDSGKRNQWHESLAQAVEYAKLKWIRIASNQRLKGYDIFEAEKPLPEPEWPTHGIDALVEIAFRGRIIDSLDHPVVQSLLGKV